MVEVSAENITLVTVISFLSMFFILVASMPSGILQSPQQGKVINVPEYFEAIDLSYFAATKNFTLGTGYVVYDFALGGWNFQFEVNDVNQGFLLFTYDSWAIFKWNYESFTWHNNKGITVSVNEGIYLRGGSHNILKWTQLDPNYDSNSSLCEFTLDNPKTQCKIYFAFNTTRYNSPYAALQSGDLNCLIAIGIDKVNTSINAWNFIGMLLFFQAPDVHPLLNAIIAIPIWVMIAWLIYILILKAIPFVGG
jgi:hypothetical protein